jgi:hypothetical protein
MSAIVRKPLPHTRAMQVAAIVFVLCLLVALITVQAGGTTANLDVTLLCVISLTVIVLMLWRPGEPPVLLFALVYQWLQVATKTFHANLVGAPLDQFVPWAPVAQSTTIGLAGLVAIAAGLKLGAGRTLSDLDERARAEASGVRLVQLVQLHLFVLLAVEVLLGLGNLGGLYQVVASLAQLRFATLFVIGFVAITQRKGIAWFALLAGFEIVHSLGGFFAGFRMPVYVAFLAVATTLRRITPARFALSLALAAGALYLGVVWQAIKGEYRDVANQGTGAQVVVLDRTQQFETLVDLWGDANGDLGSRGIEGLAQRLAYVDLLAYAIQFVPNTRPFSGGEVWGGALLHILIPRLFWPEKPDLQSDTEFTRDFTGLALLSARNDTSISIGYVGDAYIDFGQPGMYALLFVLGLCFGALYRALLRLDRGLVLMRFGIAVAIFLVLANFEITAAKLLGGLLTPWLVGYFGSRLFLDEISRWITRPLQR